MTKCKECIKRAKQSNFSLIPRHNNFISRLFY